MATHSQHYGRLTFTLMIIRKGELSEKAKRWRPATQHTYVDARAARELDNVFGAFNWKVGYTVCDMGEIAATTYNGEITKNVKGFRYY